MRIVSIAQTQQKVPTTFRDQPIPPQAIQAIKAVDSRFNLSYGEVEWIVESMEEDFHLFTRESVDWGAVEKNLGVVFEWARDTKKSVLRITMTAALTSGITYALDKKVKEQFATRDWGVKYLLAKGDDFKRDFLAFDALFEGGITFDEAWWLENRWGLKNAQRFSGDPRMAKIIKWSRATKTNLRDMNDREVATSLAEDWADYQRKVELSKRISPKGMKSMPIQQGWKAVWIDPEAEATPPAKPIMVDHPGAVPRTHENEYEVEQQITGLRMRNTDKVISIRDPAGVSQASIEIGDETNERIDVLEVAGTEIGKKMVRAFVDLMRQKGVRMWRAGDALELDSISELAANIEDEFGLVPLVYIKNIGNLDGDRDSYKEALDKAYASGDGRSSFYMSAANRSADAVVAYAAKRGELHVVESACDLLDDWAMNQWTQYEDQNYDNLPRYPDGDNERFRNPDGSYNQAAFAAAEAAYYRELAPYEESFEPFAFIRNIRQNITSGMKKPEFREKYREIKKRERAEYAKKERQRKREEQKAQREREEAERPERERREREEAAARAEQERVNREQAIKDMVNEDPDLPDDFPVSVE